MKKLWPLVALGIGAFVVFALLTLPARFLLSPLASSGVQAAGVSGTVWNGRAQVLQIGSVNLGGAQWKLHMLPLFTGRLSAEVHIKRLDGFAQAEVSASPSGRISFQGLSSSLPLSALPPTLVPGGWAGTLNLRLSQLTMENRWPVRAAGTIEVVDITGPARKPANMGSYKITFPEDAPGDAIVGAIIDTGGPLQVAGTVQLKPERSYLVEGLIATRAQAPRDVSNAVQFLGEPDAQGRRPFSFAGTL